jgi:predicted Zn-dependent protease
VIIGNHATNTQFYINLNGAPVGAYQAIQNALNTWDTVIPGMFKPLIVDNTTTGGQPDGKDVISWGSCANGATAQTYLWPGTQERDIVFSTAKQWSVAPNVTYHSHDVQNIVTHELGHVIGLGDIYREDSNYVTMFGYAPMGETSKDVLSPSDIYGVQQIYGVAA